LVKLGGGIDKKLHDNEISGEKVNKSISELTL
jgi:hypothetical protein